MDDAYEDQMIEVACWSCDSLIGYWDPEDPNRPKGRVRCGYAGEFCKQDHPTDYMQYDFDAEREREAAMGIW
jgi:hypothetical protein